MTGLSEKIIRRERPDHPGLREEIILA